MGDDKPKPWATNLHIRCVNEPKRCFKTKKSTNLTIL